MRVLRRLNDDWVLATEIHKLEARLWRRTQRDKLRVIMITSADRGEGKSTTVAYLATALALHPDRKIVAIDLDFRDPRLNSHFELDIPLGLGAVLRGECPLQDAILKTALPNLDLALPLPAGEDPNLLLRTRELSQIFDWLRQQYDLVLIDVPALIPVADASAVLPFADGVILMGMAGKTTRPMLTRAREICVGMDANILGIIVGNLREATAGYVDAGYYYGYRKRRAEIAESTTRKSGT
jgi:capsular exopolysaccharide synthesis family protein